MPIQPRRPSRRAPATDPRQQPAHSSAFGSAAGQGFHFGPALSRGR